MPVSMPRLSEQARHVVYPPSIVTSAWPMVREQCAEMGVRFDDWQDGVGTLALGKDRAGKYAATVGGVVLSIPRQVGKTFLVGMILIALCVLHSGMTVLWTAHRTRTSTMTFQSMQGMARRKRIAPHVLTVRTANGEQEIRFRNGSVIMFGAREQGFGRGFDRVDVEVFDEAQILTSKALDDMVPAMNQSQHPAGGLLFFIGTPPRPTDPGEEFTARRQKALSGKASNMVYVEFSADPDADPDDREQWAVANPSYPTRTPLEAMERMREQLVDDESFSREALGIWRSADRKGVIPFDAWQDRRDDDSLAVSRFALGVEVGPDLASASVALAGQRDDKDWHVALAETRSGGAWVEGYVAEVVEANPQVRAVVVDVGGPISALLEQHGGGWRFRSSKVPVQPVKVAELGQACSRLLDGIVAGWLRHVGQSQLDAAVQVAGKRRLGDTGMWVFSRKATTSDITPIQAATLALHGAQQTRTRRPSKKPTSGRKVVTG